ncbi:MULTISPECIES: hypothetical protein [unclassified Prochlorococcus]|nr:MULTISPECIES: hypothetical protein [unclassified Prochlorococcus]
MASFFFLDISSGHSGLNRFTEIDSFNNWIIEQKFDSETKKVVCRASMKGDGTWFAAKIRLNKNDEVLLPHGDSKHKEIELDDLEHVRSLLRKCRASLLYLLP